MKVRVRYTADFETFVEVETLADLPDAIADIEIPENKENQYVPQTYETLGAWDENENPVPVDEENFDLDDEGLGGLDDDEFEDDEDDFPA